MTDDEPAVGRRVWALFEPDVWWGGTIIGLSGGEDERMCRIIFDDGVSHMCYARDVWSSPLAGAKVGARAPNAAARAAIKNVLSTKATTTPRPKPRKRPKPAADNGDKERVPKRKLLREPPPSRDEDSDDDGGPDDCGAPRDKRIAKLFYRFLWFRATQRRRMYPRERVVGSGKEAGILGRTS